MTKNGDQKIKDKEIRGHRYRVQRIKIQRLEDNEQRLENNEQRLEDNEQRLEDNEQPLGKIRRQRILITWRMQIKEDTMEQKLLKKINEI